MTRELSPRDLRDSYDRSAPHYDRRFEALQREKHDLLLARTRPPRGGLVLDVGAGTGLLAARLAPARVVALDLSRGMLLLARERAPRRVQADARSLPFRDASFEAAFAVTSLLMSARELPRALVELHRVLAPGAELALSLLRADVAPGFRDDLRACGFEPGPELPCGQDLAWVARRVP